MTPVVHIVGAGPGDPELVTLKAVRLLSQADVVLYDRLANPDILKHAAKAECIFVGKKPGEDSAVRQDRIHEAMVRYARAGNRVVRLKGGDPCVFGRAGEEIQALSKAGIGFEIVSGITSAIAGPAHAGIPVTQRGVASSFSVFAGHESEQDFASSVDWKLAAQSPTSVFLMGVERLPVIVRKLLEHGRKESEPVCLIEKATLPDERVYRGTLGSILETARAARPPAVIVVGQTALIGEETSAFNTGGA